MPLRIARRICTAALPDRARYARCPQELLAALDSVHPTPKLRWRTSYSYKKGHWTVKKPLLSRKIEPGMTLELGPLEAISGESVTIPRAQLVHLQLRRFAGCPVCALHLRSIVHRHDELLAAGIREVVVFHSPREELRIYAGDLPFPVIADPKQRLYEKLGAERGHRALLDPRAWLAILWAVASTSWAVLWKKEALPPSNPSGGRFGLPAEFLIAPDGRVLAAKYGAHVYDQWSVDELLALAAAKQCKAAETALLPTH